MADDKKKLYDYMATQEDEEAPDEAWQQLLEDAVIQYNEENNTGYDPYDEFLNYVMLKNK